MQLRRWQSEAIQAALHKYQSGQSHFLCLATPGAGKTYMASILAQRMMDQGLIDLVVCFSPSINVASSFQATLETCLHARMDGLLGSKGRVLTYQSMLNLDASFWELFIQYRILVIFDEIHHCAGDNLNNSNAWGQKILHSIQGRAAFTLAMTGTPWRSDRIPIVLSSYCQNDRIQCDYQYGLQQSIDDGVCRIPQITAIDNERVQLQVEGQQQIFTSFEDLLVQSSCTYQRLLRCEDLITHLLRLAAKRLNQLRRVDPFAGALIVAASVEHAVKIAALLEVQTGEAAAIVTYQHDDAQNTIKQFRNSCDKWIISVGMISEGTDIPRLKVCCHLTHVKTELYFRQVLGRILRSNSSYQEAGYLFMPAEPTLLEFAQRIAEDIPAVNSVKLERMDPLILPSLSTEGIENQEIVQHHLSDHNTAHSNTTSELSLSAFSHHAASPLADAYDQSLGLFGKFKQQIFQLLNT